MGVLVQVVMVAGMVTCLTTVACAYAAKGKATYYTPLYIASSSYDYPNHGVVIAATSDAIWGHRAAIGRMYRVQYCVPQPCCGQSIVVKIVDNHCPGRQGTIDLSQEAFIKIADPSPNPGKIKIQYI